MKNQVYKLNDGQKDIATLEIYVATTNEVSPYREIKEIGIVVLHEETQLDFDLDEDSTISLIKYLEESLEYIKEYNANSKPAPQEN